MQCPFHVFTCFSHNFFSLSLYSLAADRTGTPETGQRKEHLPVDLRVADAEQILDILGRIGCRNLAETLRKCRFISFFPWMLSASAMSHVRVTETQHVR
jgi:hypothetical protein